MHACAIESDTPKSPPGDADGPPHPPPDDKPPPHHPPHPTAAPTTPQPTDVCYDCAHSLTCLTCTSTGDDNNALGQNNDASGVAVKPSRLTIL